MCLSLCASCKYYQPNKKGTPLFVFGYWMGDGRCINKNSQEAPGYPDLPPHNITIESDGCGEWEAFE